MLETGYYLLTALVLILLILGYNYGLKNSKISELERKKKIRIFATTLLGFLAYAAILASTGFFKNFELPPRFPIFLIAPAFTLIGVFLYRNRKQDWLEMIPLSWPIYFQSFRILVEVLFVFSVAKGMLHPEVTIEGYNFDMIFGGTALIVGYLAFSKKVLSKKHLLYWNYLGLLVLFSVILLFTTTIFIPILWGSESSLGVIEAFVFPYLLIPAFLMPVAVAVHCFSIMQLRRHLVGSKHKTKTMSIA